MKNEKLGKKIRHRIKNLLLICTVFLTFTFTWIGGASAKSENIALAGNLDGTSPVMATTVEDIFNSGTKKQVEGKAREDIGTIQRKVGEIAGQKEGVAKQVEGKLEQTQGEAQSRLERAGSELQEASESIGEAVKDILGQ